MVMGHSGAGDPSRRLAAHHGSIVPLGARQRACAGPPEPHVPTRGSWSGPHLMTRRKPGGLRHNYERLESRARLQSARGTRRPPATLGSQPSTRSSLRGTSRRHRRWGPRPSWTSWTFKFGIASTYWMVAAAPRSPNWSASAPVRTWLQEPGAMPTDPLFPTQRGPSVAAVGLSH